MAIATPVGNTNGQLFPIIAIIPIIPHYSHYPQLRDNNPIIPIIPHYSHHSPLVWLWPLVLLPMGVAMVIGIIPHWCCYGHRNTSGEKYQWP